MVETGGLENRLRGDSHGGSNPSSSAKITPRAWSTNGKTASDSWGIYFHVAKSVKSRPFSSVPVTAPVGGRVGESPIQAQKFPDSFQLLPDLKVRKPDAGLLYLESEEPMHSPCRSPHRHRTAACPHQRDRSRTPHDDSGGASRQKHPSDAPPDFEPRL